MSFPSRLPASQRQIALMRSLWSTDLTVSEIAAKLTENRQPGEPRFSKNDVFGLRLSLGLPSRVPATRTGEGWTKPIQVAESPIGRRPDFAEIDRLFAGKSFTDARVAPSRGRMPGTPPTLHNQSSLARLA